MSNFPEYAQLANIRLIEDLYKRYLENAESVDESWRHFFEGVNFGSYLFQAGKAAVHDEKGARISELVRAYRRYGHLEASFNPFQTEKKKAKELELERLGFFSSELEEPFPTLGFCKETQAPLKEIIDALKAIYCSRIGFEYIDLDNPEIEKWIQERIEPELNIQLSIEEQHLLLEMLNNSEVLEKFLHTKYVGQTRFSLEGAETTIPILAEMIDLGAELGLEEFVIGMAHRGRLNILTNILNKPLEMLLEEFEDDTSLSFFGNDDVRYHMGFSGEWKGRSGKKVSVEIAANPSHLEAVDPIVIGQTYAKQIQREVAPILIHGDASIAGQGVVYETMQLMRLPNYSVGGTIHLIINNQIGYTTLPKEGRSTRYCSDIAKTFGCPVFHVNAEDPESCIFAAKLAIEIRQKFHIDVFIDLYCYRKYGHNEGDEPSYTQPIEYQLIRSKKPIREIYLQTLLQKGALEKKMAETLEMQYRDKLTKALAKVQEKKGNLQKSEPPGSVELIETRVDEKILKQTLDAFCKIPEGFHPHPKLQKWLQDRFASLTGQIDWASAECLCFGSLLLQGVPIRLAGQDSQRGTFSQRHMIWTDFETGKTHCPLCNLNARFEVVNSALTENAGMGFEFGYSSSTLNSLVLWEAQYGDFCNGAQVVIDQFLVCSEPKWKIPSALTLLLPHGYEGAGPEHSSARIERFLQLAANLNIQVVYPSTPAQYFHLLRRQALSKVKRPLIVFTPKSLLRNKACTSTIQAFTNGQFEEILDDPTLPKKCQKLILCTGKIFYDLLASRKREDVAIIRIEQLYPLHLEKLKKLIEKYGASKCIWVQEEPENMGAYRFIASHLHQIAFVGRAANATTATGSSQKHKQEQQQLLERAFE